MSFKLVISPMAAMIYIEQKLDCDFDSLHDELNWDLRVPPR
jgi:hypothetical protein